MGRRSRIQGFGVGPLYRTNHAVARATRFALAVVLVGNIATAGAEPLPRRSISLTVEGAGADTRAVDASAHGLGLSIGGGDGRFLGFIEGGVGALFGTDTGCRIGTYVRVDAGVRVLVGSTRMGRREAELTLEVGSGTEHLVFRDDHHALRPFVFAGPGLQMHGRHGMLGMYLRLAGTLPVEDRAAMRIRCRGECGGEGRAPDLSLMAQVAFTRPW